MNFPLSKFISQFYRRRLSLVNILVTKNSISFLIFTLSLACTACASTPKQTDRVSIELYSGNQAEKKAKDLLLDLFSTHDLSTYTFTDKVIIRSRTIPHSHPVLTLNTRLINKPKYFLSTYLHEQIHWHFSRPSLKNNVDLFIDKMKEIYPKVPVGSANGGANDEKSTYLHMGVNLLEYDALRIFVENQSAKDIFQKKDVYKWINQIVLKDYFKIRRVLDQLGLLIEDRNVFKVYDDLEKYDGNILKKKQEFAAKPINLENIDDVKIKLDFLVEIDQYMRSQINLPFTHQYNKSEINFFNKEFNQRFTSLDEENTHDLKDILKRYKWINISQFGEKADRDAWLIVQHADNDPEFQKEILSVLKNLWEQGETNAANYAYLFDRVQSSFSDLSKQRPQKYGTQGKCVGPGKWEPLPIEDKEHVDSRRSKLGLPPMSEYIEGFKEICK